MESCLSGSADWEREVMEIIDDVNSLRNCIQSVRKSSRRVGFVPTMGYLHEGHLSLVRVARAASDFVAVSIFVNPTQFNNPEDLDSYPRDEERDFALLAAEGVDLVFLPGVKTMYPEGFQSYVHPGTLAEKYEGEHRPGHFRGVATVVSLLFNLVQPDCAVFGEKDFQQLRVIEKLVDDLRFPISILRGAIVREADGLAMSSRNVRLSDSERAQALVLSRALFLTRDMYRSGEYDAKILCSAARRTIEESGGLEMEYLVLVDEALRELENARDESRILLAGTVGSVRLIDNIRLGASPR